jgi:hypothetical protein
LKAPLKVQKSKLTAKILDVRKRDASIGHQCHFQHQFMQNKEVGIVAWVLILSAR